LNVPGVYGEYITWSFLSRRIFFNCSHTKFVFPFFRGLPSIITQFIGSDLLVDHLLVPAWRGGSTAVNRFH
jgi:hypothetical protein